MHMRVAIVDRARTGAGRWIGLHARRLLKLLGVTDADWTITIVRDPQMKALHHRTMNLATTTDVLTFDMRDTPGRDREGAPVELDTVICADEARRRAADLGHPFREELLLYVLHSLLHVQGYDDTTPAKFRRMHRREDELLEQLGLPRLFAGSNSGRGAA